MTETPRYRLITPHFLDDDYIEEGEVIEYAGVPTESMEPLNEPARDRLIEYIGSLEHGKRTPKLEDVVFQQMLSRPKELSSPELLAAVEIIQRMAKAKEDGINEPREKSYKLPERRDDVPQTSADPKTQFGRKRSVVRHGQPQDDAGQKVRKIAGNVTV